jgi:hypothetical protein
VQTSDGSACTRVTDEEVVLSASSSRDVRGAHDLDGGRFMFDTEEWADFADADIGVNARGNACLKGFRRRCTSSQRALIVRGPSQWQRLRCCRACNSAASHLNPRSGQKNIATTRA